MPTAGEWVAIQNQMVVDQIRANNRRADSAKIVGDALRELIDQPDDALVPVNLLRNYIRSLSINFTDLGVYLLPMSDWDWYLLMGEELENNEWRYF